MIVDAQKYWEEMYQSDDLKFPVYDGWLDKYIDLLEKAENIIDLGCGNGVDTIFLANRNISCISCDFSETALLLLKQKYAKATTEYVDISKKLPFKDCYSNLVIADLSLHYFDFKTTEKIITEIKRILTPEGVLLCRVNSTDEYKNSPDDVKIEDNYYLINGCYKRFFAKKDIERFFCEWNIKYIQHNITDKYRSKKCLWELSLVKR